MSAPPIFHIAFASAWEEAQRTGVYTTSTRGQSLAEVGFIHASRADQWTTVRARFYADVVEPLVLLQIDPARLDVPLVEEPAVPGGTETFPHIYGPLPAAAVVKAIALSSTPDAAIAAPALSAAVAPVPAASPVPDGESFSRAYFREMFFNVTVLSLALALSAAGLGIGLALGGDVAPGVGGLVGLALGAGAAVVLYRRRHAARG